MLSGFLLRAEEPCTDVGGSVVGALRTCLFSLNETDLRAGASDDELEVTVREAVWQKELKHHINEPGFIQPNRSMSQTGGYALRASDSPGRLRLVSEVPADSPCRYPGRPWSGRPDLRRLRAAVGRGRGGAPGGGVARGQRGH